MCINQLCLAIFSGGIKSGPLNTNKLIVGPYCVSDWRELTAECK